MDDTLIIFDCDGVLVNSEPLAARVLAEAIRGLGLAMENDEAAEVFLGCSMEMVIEIVTARLGHPVEAGFTKSFLDQLHIEMRRDLAAIAGVGEAIEQIQLNENVGGLCVASNGEPETVALSLEAVGLISFFKGRLYTASAAGRPKPHPDLFLFAAREMNFLPAKCIVIEDSLHGVNAALAAEMRVFRYAPHAEAVEIRDHTHSIASAKIFVNMNQLPRLIAVELQR
ncbi:MAG: HAD family hydrolase [Proteobacteria bacterium]|nr:HAD family hydrolase [Pseudomonadota bacterium]MDA1354741.1 HAD family hydrolase [Pseudomonadota bacterium]